MRKFHTFRNTLFILFCCLSLAACENNQAEETAENISTAPTAESGFSQKIDGSGQIGDALPLVGKALGELPVIGEEDPVYCNLPENVRGWDDLIPLCVDPLYGILYYVDYGGDYKIHAVYNEESQTVLELPGKRLFCRDGKLYFLLESYNQFGFEGAKSGNIAEYNPVTGEVKVLLDQTFSSIVVYQDMIYCKREGEEKFLGEGKGYIVEEDFWFYFFDTGELIAGKTAGREYVMDFRRYGEYFLAAALKPDDEYPQYDVQTGTELRKWDGEQGTFWGDLKLMPSSRYYIKDGNFYWLNSKGFHQWNPISGEDTVYAWKLGLPDQYVLVGDWLLSAEHFLVNTEEGKVESWIIADEKLQRVHEIYTDGEKIYVIVGLSDHEMEEGSVLRRVEIRKGEVKGYELLLEKIQK